MLPRLAHLHPPSMQQRHGPLCRTNADYRRYQADGTACKRHQPRLCQAVCRAAVAEKKHPQRHQDGKVPKTRCSIIASIAPAAIPPSQLPTSMPGVNLKTCLQSTAPRFWWARIAASEVKTIVVSEVPTAICTTRLASTPTRGNPHISAGTTTRPPPTPNRPATIPTTPPRIRKSSVG